LVALVKAVPGNVSLESMLTEIRKLGDRDLQREMNEGLNVVEL
jgi:hypothetical protein